MTASPSITNFHAVRQRSLDNPRIALAPVIAAARDQPYAVAVAFNSQAITIIFDLVKPFRAGRDFGSHDRDAELKRYKHGSKIALVANFANPISDGKAELPGRFPSGVLLYELFDRR